MAQSAQPTVPAFEVHLAAPDIGRWVEGNTGTPGFTTRATHRPGPHVLLLAVSHGNEIAGAIALDRLLTTDLWPARGRLTFGFVNLAAFERFDPRQPTLSRFIDEDINRVWDLPTLDGPRCSVELERARAIRPMIDSADVVLDLHSMLWPSDPLMLCGKTPKGRALAAGIGTPELVVADHGHATGPRLLDYSRFAAPDTPFVANLVEAGQHWQPATVDAMLASIAGLLRHLGMAPETHPALPPPRAERQRFAEVTDAVAATTGSFAFVQTWRGGEVIPHRNTLIALDGSAEIRTPYDDCLLVMPSLRPSRGHTAVRLARFIPE
ncbi:MAG TPA: succinylglutamate desuccinylase/aspartoacylase family protein [Acetobacteraceae bacterium]|nr:succinylglutamate desuccinylase/aspartoacylase family protein [Acetobacteraceae bacterium]